MAYGYKAYLSMAPRGTNFEERKNDVYLYSKVALRSRNAILRSPNTILKLQASRNRSVFLLAQS